jgi:ribosome biogenesis GTPase
VARAVEAGDLSADRAEGYRKLAAEARWAAARTDERVRAERKRRERIISRAVTGVLRTKYGKR